MLLCPGNVFGHLAATAVPSGEEWRDGAYRRALRLLYGHGIARWSELDHVACQLFLVDLRDLSMVISRCRPGAGAVCVECANLCPGRDGARGRCPAS